MTVSNVEALTAGEAATTDARIMRETLEGDPDAFATLVDRYKDALVNYLTHLTFDRDRAEEIAQESFLRLFQAAHQYEERGKLTSYLYSIATNLVRSEQRRRKRWNLLVPRFTLHVDREEPTPQAGLLEDEIRSQVRRALEQLPLHFRAPLVLREIEGWSYERIAEALDCRVGTVKSRISRGRERLKDALEPYWRGAGNEDA
jgi:RNA polymerase sigma-70 factor, ECF subfamily